MPRIVRVSEYVPGSTVTVAMPLFWAAAMAALIAVCEPDPSRATVIAVGAAVVAPCCVVEVAAVVVEPCGVVEVAAAVVESCCVVEVAAAVVVVVVVVWADTPIARAAKHRVSERTMIANPLTTPLG